MITLPSDGLVLLTLMDREMLMFLQSFGSLIVSRQKGSGLGAMPGKRCKQPESLFVESLSLGRCQVSKSFLKRLGCSGYRSF